MQGIIQQTNPSKSGKTLSVQINGQWYSTKHWELQNMVGQEITAQTSESDFNGTIMHWLNDYTASGQGTTPSAQAFDQAHAQGSGPAIHQNQPPPSANYQPPPQPTAHDINAAVAAKMVPPSGEGMHPAPQTAPVDRDASITALALCKTVQPGEGIEDAWKRYVALYYKVLEWNPGSFDDDPRY